MDVQNFQNLSLDEVIFLGRNKAYGSYTLRKIYQKNMLRGVAIGILLFALLLATPFISQLLGKAFKKPDKLVYSPIVLAQPPAIDPEKKFIPPPPPPPPPVQKQIRLIPPKVVETKELPNTPPLPPDIPKDANIGTTDVKGDLNAFKFTPPVDIAPPPPPKEKEVEKPKEDRTVFITVEQNPEFPNGEAALFKYLSSNIKYPTIARENGIEGTVFLGFVIERDGSITDVKIKRAVGGGCSEEAMRVVQLMPKWKPGKQQGKAVRVAFTIPVKFKLDQ